MNKLYGQNRIVKQGKYKNMNYIIKSYSTHPCCYIEIPPKHYLYEDEYDSFDCEMIECHGGITFSRKANFTGEEKFYIGWDYAHYNDYFYEKLIINNFPETNKSRKKWTIKELEQECKNVIKQII